MRVTLDKTQVALSARGCVRRPLAPLLVLGLILLWSATASAQLDPLLFLKRVPPTVILVVDTSLRMLEDGRGNFYDPNFYSTTADPAVMGAFSTIDPTTAKTYRRVYRNLTRISSPAIGYAADLITASPAVYDPSNPATANAPADTAFLNSTRWAIARRGIASAVSENASSPFRWGLIRLRQASPTWRVSPDCDRPVLVSDATQALFGDADPCNAGSVGRYGIYAPNVSSASYLQSSAPSGTVMVIPAAFSASSVLGIVNRQAGDNAGLVPAGKGDVGFDDRPINYALLDARTLAASAMAADAAANRVCRNTVVVLLTGGKDDGSPSYTSSNDPAATASSFLSVTGGGVTKRVPIFVVGLVPAAADEPQLQAIATNSGGLYRRVASATEVAAVINHAVQAGFRRSTEFDAGTTSEFVPVSPIVGTVNLKGASSATGSLLPYTDITATSPTHPPLPQRSNVMVTAGFALPGFDGRIRAFRVYRPEPDSTKPTGWKFVQDGTRLWPDLDGRPALAGLARTPADPSQRNIYTFIPTASGGGSVVPFTAANAASIGPHLGGVSDVAGLIQFVRERPIGAVIGSTPALMDAPSLDPPPDDDYGRADAPETFAGTYKNRRSMLFFGANDGMIHAVDARTGYEVWAFIPYNLLPKLRALADGQPVDQFDYFVDSSPKIAEVKLGGVWRSMLIIGQGLGGTFYQAFDVTEAGMGVDPQTDGLSSVSALLTRFDSVDESIRFEWAFPNYSSFNPSYTASFALADGSPGGRIKFFGDLKSTATHAEKTVGFTWSDPAVGPLDGARTKNAVIVGSGYFPDIEFLLPGRGSGAPKAGATLYLLDAATGELIGNPSQGSCSASGCLTLDDVANGRKNALQADPTAAGESSSTVVTKAYLGDVDGKYWRFNFDATGAIQATEMVDTGSPIYASSALLFIGSADVYMFFATGSDLLPVSASGGIGTFRLFGLKDNGYAGAATVMFARDLDKVTASGALATGERPSTSPSVAGDIVFYTTTVESATTPCADFRSRLYALTYAGGAAYDTDNSGKLEKNESPIARAVAGRATAPFIVDQHLYFGTISADGAMVEAFGDPEDFNNGIGQVGVRIMSWREIR